MKKYLSVALIFALLLSGCGSTGKTEVTTIATEATTEATTESTTAPTEPPVVYRNPLNGEILEEPFTGRPIAVTVTNTQDALPHVGVNDADLFFEAYVSRGVVRCLAMYTDISDMEAMGCIRSTRLLFNQLAYLYDSVLIHGGGFSQVLEDAKSKNLDHFNVDSLYRQGDPYAKATAYRDKVYNRYAPNNLFANGPGILAYLEQNEVRLIQDADKDYGLTFVDDATPTGGEVAEEVTITFGDNYKTTTMVYDDSIGKYVYNQYGQEMTDQVTGEKEVFKNVIVLQADVYENYIYQEANFHVGGTGYYACNGKLIPVTWEPAEEDNVVSPFRFKTLDGEQLDINVGNSYIAIVGFSNPITWKAADPVETVPETTAETLPELTESTVAAS